MIATLNLALRFLLELAGLVVANNPMLAALGDRAVPAGWSR